MKQPLLTLLLGGALLTSAAVADAPPSRPAAVKLLLIGSGPDGHPAQTHEYMAGLKILAKLLKDVPGLEITTVRADEPWRDGPELIARADGVVLFLSEGARWMNHDAKRREALTAMAKRGGGISVLHWAMGTKDAKYIDGCLQLLGGCHGGPDRKYKVLETQAIVAERKHPIAAGIKDFRVRDEFYYRLKFIKAEKGIDPLIRVTIDGQPDTVGWCWERPDHGRSFGFSGLHFHDNWRLTEYRRLIAQGVLWTLKKPIPKEGLAVEVTEDDLKLPDKSARGPMLDRFGDPLPEGAIRRFGTLRFRHPGSTHLAFTPDGKKLIAGGNRSPLSVFDAATGRRLCELGRDHRPARDLMDFAVSPDGKRIAGCGSDVFVWDSETGRLIRSFYFNDRYKEVVFSPDGARIAAIKEARRRQDYQLGIVIGDLATGRHAEDWSLKEGEFLTFSVHGLAFSPDGKFLGVNISELHEEKPAVYSAVLSHVWLLDAATGKRVRSFGSADVAIVCFAFQPVSGRLATYGKDGMIRFWEVATGKEVEHFQAAKGHEGNGFGELRFSADGRRCAVLTNRAKFLTVLDAKDGQIIRRIEGEESGLKVALALSADGGTVASSRLYDEFCTRVWDVASGVERLADAGHRAAVTSLSLSSDDRTLISEDSQGQRIRWNRQTGKGETRSISRREVIGRVIRSSDFSQETLLGPRWRMVYKNQRPATMEVWSLDGAKLIGKWETHTPYVARVVLSADGTQLAIPVQQSSFTYTVMVWEPEREGKPRLLPGHPDACWELIFSHDGKRLIGRVGFNRGNPHSGFLWIWDIKTARLIHTMDTNSLPGHLLLSADDRVLLAGSSWEDASVQAWDLETGRELARMAVPGLKPVSVNSNMRSRPGITGLALSADERFVAVFSSQDDASSLSIWEMGSWKLIRTFAATPSRNDGRAMLFSRAGRSLFVANSDSTILEWDVSGRQANGRRQPAGAMVNEDRLNALWRALAETPDKVYPAVWEMLDHPKESVRFLINKVSPIGAMEEKHLRQLLEQLDSASFAEREEASRLLLVLGEQFLPMLHHALSDRPSLEMKKRLEGILESLRRGPTAEQLRLLRALAVLEWSAQPEADQHLRRVAEGVPSASLTQAAKAALRRRVR